MKMTEDEYALYSAINHADDEWTPKATAVLNQIKARVWDEGADAMADAADDFTGWISVDGQMVHASQLPNPYRSTENTGHSMFGNDFPCCEPCSTHEIRNCTICPPATHEPTVDT